MKSVRDLFFSTALALALAGCSSEPEYVATLVTSPKTVVVRPGQCSPLQMRWTPAAPLETREGKPTVFVHLLDGPHNLVRTYDHPLTFEWKVGTPVTYDLDICQSALVTPLAPGAYNLKVGLYDDLIGYRWPLKTEGFDAGKRSYRVGHVVVPSTPGNAPRFTFSGNWGGREELKDKQIRARQRFTTGARVKVEGVTTPGAARILVRIPDRGTATVQSTCGGQWSSNAGHHSFELPIAQDGCELVFSSPGAYLEGLAWKSSPRVAPTSASVLPRPPSAASMSSRAWAEGREGRGNSQAPDDVSCLRRRRSVAPHSFGTDTET